MFFKIHNGRFTSQIMVISNMLLNLDETEKFSHLSDRRLPNLQLFNVILPVFLHIRPFGITGSVDR